MEEIRTGEKETLRKSGRIKQNNIRANESIEIRGKCRNSMGGLGVKEAIQVKK